MRYLLFSFTIYLSIFCPFAQNGTKRVDLKEITDKIFIPKKISDDIQLWDAEHYTMLSEDRSSILKYAYKTGKAVETLFSVKTARECTIDKIEGYMISPTGFRIIVWTDKEYIYRRSWQANLYDFDVRRNLIKPLSDSPGKLRIPTFSPDGRMCAFVRDNNIWLKKFDFDTESQVTKDGALNQILNGVSDWAYEEEFYVTNQLAWSPDNKFLTFVKSDESQVPLFSYQTYDDGLYPQLKQFKYPKAGEKNSIVTVHSYSVDTKDIKKMNLPIDEDAYIPRITFTNNPDQLAVMTLNRQQNKFNMYYVNPKSGIAKLILQDENPYYIDSDWLKSIEFTNDNFTYVSEKNGFAHIYLYTVAGILQKQVTSGNWDVTAFLGIDPVSKNIYYESAEESPLRRSIYKIDAKGNKTKLSSGTGTNTAFFSSGFNYFINQYSGITTPGIITVNDSQGKELVVLEDNQVIKSKLSELRFSGKEFFKFETSEGNELNGWIIKPTNFNPSEKYPVLMMQYSGPNSQEVKDKFDFGWEYYLAANGYVVVAIDGRGTGARGQAFRKSTYMKLGIQESDDQIAGARYLGTLNYVDKDRIAIWGWSYGGYMTLMSMSRGNGIFKAGIAIAPVTDWKFYNSIYTERFMRSPQENFEGYKQSSPITYVENLQGKLLIVHGTADDNVHFQNTLLYTQALVEAGKQFDMQIYTDKGHSLTGKITRYHLYSKLSRFLFENL